MTKLSELSNLLRELWHYRALRNSEGSLVRIAEGTGYELVGLPSKIWSTKSHGFWTLLSVMLHRLRPARLLELGSGRSTVYLSEYAMKCGAELVSVDQQAGWIAVNRLIARFGGLPADFLHRVPLQEDGFYSVPHLRKLMQDPELVFIDGPVRRGSTESQMSYLTDMVRQARMVVLDDVHRRHIYDQIALLEMAMRAGGKRVLTYDVGSDHPNALCVLVDDESQSLLEEAMRFLDLSPVAYARADCTED